MPNLPKAKIGKLVKDSPTGFPLYFKKRQPRVVTADVWAYFRHVAIHRLPKKKEIQALAFIDQALEFFETAENPRIGSRPLLYYYSFLNLAKVALLINRVKLPPAPRHGISDPRENVREKMQLQGQRVRFEVCGHDHSQLFPEFVKILGGEISGMRTEKVVSLLRQIPSVHRTFCMVTGEEPSFVPIKKFHVLRTEGKVFIRLILDKTDADVWGTLKKMRTRQSFKSAFEEVQAPQDVRDQELWFETEAVAGTQKATTRATIDSAIRILCRRLKTVGVWSILTGLGYRFYLSTIRPVEKLPPLASVYAVMFYFGSITRYKPYDFDRIVSRKFSWLVSEFLKTQPTQFLYGLAGHVAGVDVVRPFASVD